MWALAFPYKISSTVWREVNPVEDFLEAYPTVIREQAIAVIEAGKLKMLETA